MRKLEWMVVLAGVLALGLAAPSLAGEIAQVDLESAAARWDVQQGDFVGFVLTVSSPDGSVVRREFKSGEAVVFELDAAAKDGSYKYELRGIPRIDASVRKELAAARRAGNEAAVIERLQDAGRLPREGAVQSGSFLVKDGAIVSRDRQETGGPRAKSAETGIGIITAEDQVIPDDLIVQGSGCFGFDCVNNESFGFDTIRLKENNLRIKFEDTSAGTFPSNDWQLTANDSASGGSNKFSIEDITGAKVPFTITAGASTNSIFVDSTGRVGFRTSTPVLDLHVATSNTPAIRLEQNNSGGFTAQTWDIGGNEANFFVRDVTGGSRLPFRIRPGAPTSSIDINASGNVCIGAASCDHNLEVSEEGAAEIAITNTTGTDVEWFFQVDNDTNKTLKISQKDTGGTEVTVDKRLDANGATLRVDGSVQATNVTFTSSRDFKESIVGVDPQEVLTRVASLPIAEWKFKEGRDDVRHIGPMAEDFHAAFQLSPDSKTISVTDTSGVALAAIQGLLTQVQELQKQNAELVERLQTLEKQFQQQ